MTEPVSKNKKTSFTDFLRKHFKGILDPILEEGANYVSAPIIMKERGIKIVETKSEKAEGFSGQITLRAKTKDGERLVGGRFSYELRPGDTLHSISARYGPAAVQRALEAAKAVAPDRIEIELIDIAGLKFPVGMLVNEPLAPGEQDDFPPIAEKLSAPDVAGIIVGTPTYFANMSSLCKAFLERWMVFRKNGFTLSNKVGGVLATGGARVLRAVGERATATTATTISAGTPSTSMLVIEAAAANGNTAGNGITLNNASREAARFGTLHRLDVTGMKAAAIQEAQNSGILIVDGDIDLTCPDTGTPAPCPRDTTMLATITHQYDPVLSFFFPSGITIRGRTEMRIP